MAQSRTVSLAWIAIVGFALSGPLVAPAGASSHREAPAIANDALADNTDVYAFISPNDSDKVVAVANYVPLLLPDSGPNFYRFDDSVRYEMRFDNDGDARADITYQFEFRTELRDGSTFLYNTGPVASIDDPNLNVRQFFSLTRIDHARKKTEIVADDVPVAPWNVGQRSFPDYTAVADQAVYDVGDGTKVFTGPRDEPFFVDLRVFDLLGVGGKPSTDGLNVMSLVLEVPIEDLASDGVRPSADETGPESILGVYARSMRRRYRILGRRERAARNHGRWVQVSRLAFPLINEVVVPLKDKDAYNRLDPENDVERFGQYILSPEFPGLLASVLGLPCPPTPPGGRTDIVDVLSPNGTTPADLLRINITEGQTFAHTAFPNGRALTDDVTDALLTLVCNGGVPVGDGVDANDLAFSDDFPYLAGPHPGKESTPAQDVDQDGVTAANGDCDDGDPTVKPGAPEICDEKDNDCNGVVDDSPTDLDGDLANLCQDCDDSDPAVAPGGLEFCDGKDNDCNGVVDDVSDLDGDGFDFCVDCDDEDSEVFPGRAEVCFNGKDDDCDTSIDEGCTTTFGRAVILDDELEIYAPDDVVCLDQVTNGGCIFFEEGDCVDDEGVSQPHLHGLVQFLGLDGPIPLILGQPGFYQEFNPVCGFGDVVEGVPGCGPDLVVPCGPPVS